jgi:hypothetical protein
MNHYSSTRKMGLAVLAGGLAFVGSVEPTELIVDGSFEDTRRASNTVRNGGTENPGVGEGWSIFSTYLYSTQYTFPGPANSGTQFLRPYPPNTFGIPVSSEVVTQVVDLIESTGLTWDEIDQGFAQYTFSAWFSSYLTQGDFSTVTLQFIDDIGGVAGDLIVLGGQDFVANIPIGNNGRYPDAKQWAQDTRTGIIPLFARTAVVTAAAGNPRSGAPDGYVDLVSLDVEDLSEQAPRIVSAIPANNSGGVGPIVDISVTLRDNVTSVNTNSIRLYLDNNLVSPTIQSLPPNTNIVSYTAGLLPALSAHSYAIVFSDNGIPPTTQSNRFQFTVADYMTLPTTQKSALGSEDVSKPGFNVKVYQVDALLAGEQTSLTESIELSESALAGLLGPNVADLSLAVASNRFEIPGVINFTNSSGAVGNLTNDLPFPGIPGTTASENDFVHETLTYLRFPTAGYYQMGVNNDDQFRLSLGETGVVTLEVVSPNPVVIPAVAIATNVTQLQFGGSLPLTPLTGQLVYATPSGNPDAACSIGTDPTLAGKIVLLDRAEASICDNAAKAEQAQLAGAIAVIMITPGDPGFPMRLDDANPNIQIPVLVIAENYGGTDLKGELASNPEVTVRIRGDNAPRLMEWNAPKGFGAVDVTIGFAVPEPGIYPFRLISGQSTGAGSLEWFSIFPDGTKVLINDTSNANALRTFRARSSTARPVFAAPTLLGGQVQISWTGAGTLQEALSVTGQWTTAASQANPQNVTPGGIMKFYRITQP